MSPPSLVGRVRALLLADGGLPIVWIALTCFALYPVWHQRLLPMLDTPNHLALARGWHDFHDPASRIAEFYELRVRVVPYYLFYGSIHLLMYVFSVETANKIFLSAYLILFPLSVLAMARAFGRNPWLALFAFPLAFSQNWIYGFASYLMSVTFAFFAIAALVRYLESRKLRYAVALGAACLVCYLGHIMPWVLFGACAIVMLLVNWRRWQTGLVAAAMMLPSVMMAVTAILEEQGDHAYIKDSPFSGTFRDFPTSVAEFPKRVMELFPGDVDAYILAVLVVTLVGLFFWQCFGAPRVPQRDVAVDPLLKGILWILGVAYVALPYAIARPMSWWYVAPRIPPMMMVFIALLPAVDLRRWRRLAMLPVVLCAIVLPMKLAKLYKSFSQRNLPAIRLIEETPKGAVTLVVVRNMMRGSYSEEKSGDPATSGPVYWHFSSWPMALRGGYSGYTFDQGIPIRPKQSSFSPPFGAPDAVTFRSAPRFEYYVVRDAPEEMDREPSVKLVRRIADWSLYKRVHEITDEP